MIRLYRFYNFDEDKEGEPFALCDECIKKQVTPPYCYLHKIANDALIGCLGCQENWFTLRHEEMGESR